MSIWPPSNRKKLAAKNYIQCMQNAFAAKPTKIDTLGRLQIINALDNGQPKVEIAKKYGVHPQTIAYIYKQKEHIIKKYRQKLIPMGDVRSLNLDALLIDWLKLEIASGAVIYEEQLHRKAQEIVDIQKEDFGCLEEWIAEFQMRHNIAKHPADSDLNTQTREEWHKLIEEYHEDDIYIGGTTALLHKLDLDHFVQGKVSDNYVSTLLLTNTSGLDKKELVVVGEEFFEDLQSLPLTYNISENSIVKFTHIVNYLRKWDDILKSKEKHVALILNIPDLYIENMHFDNIKLIECSCKDIVSKLFRRIEFCFKYHYRRVQISRPYILLPLESSLVICLSMMSLAWYSMGGNYIRKVFHPPVEESLYFDDRESDLLLEQCQSLTKWCKQNIPLDVNSYPDLDEFVWCDSQLQSLDVTQNKIMDEALSDSFCYQNAVSSSGIEAYQAMRRILTYLQGEDANASVIDSAKHLETHLELGALVEINQFIAENSTNSVSE